mgnify:CR=1 FL=1
MYGLDPKVIGEIKLHVVEMMFYQYLPIKFPGMENPKFEDRLKCFNQLLGKVCCDYIGDFGLDAYVNSYIYLTAKRLWQDKVPFNRSGYHSDSFGSNDQNYIWYDCQPTIFNSSQFDLCKDDEISLKQMEEQAKPENEYFYPSYTILRLDEYCIHKVGKMIEGMRTFVKISFSKDKYDLEGNSHNYLIDYDWVMRPRKVSRNTPYQ